ncbi:MAG: sporulation integral membrane protein YtvI [Sarcina sp.]
MDYLKKRGKVLVIFFLLYTIGFLFFINTLKFTIPFLLAAIFACILKYPTELLIKKLKFKTWTAALLISILFYLIIVVIIAVLIAFIVSDVFSFSGNFKDLFSIHSFDVNKDIAQLQQILSSKLHININVKLFNSIKSNLFSTLEYVFKTFFNSGTSIVEEIIAFISYLPDVALGVICNVVSTYFFVSYLVKDDVKSPLLDNIPQTQRGKFIEILGHVRKTLVNYILSYALIIGFSMFFSVVGFFILGINDALILGIIAGALDLVPIIGMSILYIPLSIIHFLGGNNFLGVAIIVLYIIVCILRQIIEPRIMSNSLEIHPVVSLACFFIGLQIAGFTGVIYCFLLIVTYNILKKVNII